MKGVSVSVKALHVSMETVDYVHEASMRNPPK
jgi:hypothetical protein